MWKGRVVTDAREHPFVLGIFPSGDIHVQLGNRLKTLLNDVRFENGRLTGGMTGDLGTEDAGRRPQHIGLSLKLRGNVPIGSGTAVTRSGNLTSWLELKRQ